MSGEKTRLTIRIDREVAEKAKKASLNISKTRENCLTVTTRNLEKTYEESKGNPGSFDRTFSKGLWRPGRELNERV